MASRKEVRQFCEELINDPTYRNNLKIQFREGTLAPGLVQMIWYYAAGKPTETVRVLDPDNPLRRLSKEELSARAEALSKRILEESDQGDSIH